MSNSGLVLPSGAPIPKSRPTPTEQDKTQRVWVMHVTYIGARILEPEEKDRLADKIGDVHQRWNGPETTLTLNVQVADEEGMHLVLGSWILDVQEALAEEIGLSANNMISARIERKFLPGQKEALKKLHHSRKGKK